MTTRQQDGTLTCAPIGNEHVAHLPFADGQIAAIAYMHGLVVVPANVSDFAGLEGVVEDWSAWLDRPPLWSRGIGACRRFSVLTQN